MEENCLKSLKMGVVTFSASKVSRDAGAGLVGSLSGYWRELQVRLSLSSSTVSGCGAARPRSRSILAAADGLGPGGISMEMEPPNIESGRLSQQPRWGGRQLRGRRRRPAAAAAALEESRAQSESWPRSEWRWGRCTASPGGKSRVGWMGSRGCWG